MADQLALFTTPQVGTTSDDYYTPKWVFDALGVTFDLDVASPPGGPPFVPCRRYYTQADDGLASPWEGLVWMNPPYSKPAPWVDKFLRHGNGLALLPFTRAIWHDALWNSDTDALQLARNPNGRLLTFETSQGRPQGIFMPVCLWAAGDKAKTALYNSNLGKVR
jgi:phage N-6-adenine-methyltransferase